LITIVIIGCIGILQAQTLGFEDSTIFRTTIIYAYAFSLIVVGIIQMPLTRYLADLLYGRDFKMYFPTYIGALILVGVVQFLIGAPCIYWYSDWPEPTNYTP
jgi:uncharacterized membrane protein